MDTFKLQSYTKADLAQLYSPHSGSATALQNSTNGCVATSRSWQSYTP